MSGAAKNTAHYTHLEQFALEPGGIDFAIKQVEGILSELKSGTEKTFNLQVKGEGAPGFIAGIDPTDNKFFVAYKAAAQRDNLPLMKTIEDIKKEYANNPQLRETFTELLNKLPMSIKSGFYGGDVLFSTAVPKNTKDMGNQVYVTFKPNTLGFGIIANDSDNIVKAKLGIMIHTKFSGSSVRGAGASFNVDIDKDANLKSTDKCFVTDGQSKRVFSKSVKIKPELIKNIYNKLSTLKGINRQLTEDAYSIIKPTLSKVEPYVNAIIRSEASKLSVSDKFIDGVLEKVSNKQKQMILSDKKIKDTFRQIIIAYKILFQIKILMVRALNSLDRKIDIFAGENKTDPEGYLIVDKKNNNVIKLIDRFNFSRINFASHE